MSIYAPITAQTELGKEKRCMACGEYWPSDQEFFEVMRSSRDGLSPRCIACIKDKLWQVARLRPEDTASSARPDVPSRRTLFLLS